MMHKLLWVPVAVALPVAGVSAVIYHQQHEPRQPTRSVAPHTLTHEREARTSPDELVRATQSDRSTTALPRPREAPIWFDAEGPVTSSDVIQMTGDPMGSRPPPQRPSAYTGTFSQPRPDAPVYVGAPSRRRRQAPPPDLPALTEPTAQEPTAAQDGADAQADAVPRPADVPFDPFKQLEPTPSGEAPSVELTVSPNPVSIGEALTVAWTVSPASGAHQHDWIGLYAHVALPVEVPLWVSPPTGGEPSGSVSQTLPHQLPAGVYDVRYIASRSGTAVGRARVTVTAASPNEGDEPPIDDTDDEPLYTLTVNDEEGHAPWQPVRVVEGALVRLSWSVTPASSAGPADYLQGCLIDGPAGLALTDELCIPLLVFDGQADRTLMMALPSALLPGRHELRYVAGSSGAIMDRVYLDIEEDDEDDEPVEDHDGDEISLTLTVSPDHLTRGNPLTISWSVEPEEIASSADRIELCVLDADLPAGQCLPLFALAGQAAGFRDDYVVPEIAALGTYELRYLIAEADGLVATALVTIVDGQPPVLHPIGDRTVEVGTTLTVPVSATDDQPETLQYTMSELPMGAMFNDVTHTFTWTPLANQLDIHHVTFTVTDGVGLQDTETMAITVFQGDAPPPSPALTFSANPSTISIGQDSTLTWAAEHAATCVASGGWNGTKSLNGSESVTPGITTSYTLTCSRDGLSVTKTVTVSAVAQPEPGPDRTVTLEVEPNPVTIGEPLTVRWVVSPTEGAGETDWIGFYIDGMPDTMLPPGDVRLFTDGAATGELAITIPENSIPPGEYELRYVAESQAELFTVLARRAVTVVAASDDELDEPPPSPSPTLAFSASPSMITSGQSSALTWEAEHVDKASCTASGDWSGAKAIFGSEDVSPASTSSYTLTCSGVEHTVTKTVHVTVEAFPPPALDSTDAAYQHLTERMDAYVAGEQPRLIESYMAPYPADMEGVALVSDNARAVMALLARGTADDVRRARLICDALVWHQMHDPADDGRIRPAYWADQDLTAASQSQFPALGYALDTGDMAWTGLALISAFEHTGETAYQQAAETIADVLLERLSDSSGQAGLYRGILAEQVDETRTTFAVTATPADVPLGQSLYIDFEAGPTRTASDVIQLVFFGTYEGNPFEYAPPEALVETLGLNRGRVIMTMPFVFPVPGLNEAEGEVRYYHAGIQDAGHLKASTPITVGGDAVGLSEPPPLPTMGTQERLSTEKVTAQNLAAYALLMRLADQAPSAADAQRWKTAAEDAKRFVETVTWNPNPGDDMFYVGTLADGTLDQIHAVVQPNAQAVLALGDVETYGEALVYVDGKLQATADGFSGFDAGVNGTNDDPGYSPDPDGVWFEGTAQMILGYQVAGAAHVTGVPDQSTYYLGQLEAAQRDAQGTNQKGLVAASHNGVTSGFPELTYDASPHLGTTAWYLLAKQRINPFWGTGTDAPVPHEIVGVPLTLRLLSPDVNRDGEVTVADVELVTAAYGRTEAEEGANWVTYEPYDLNGDGTISLFHDIMTAINAVGLSWPPRDVQEGRRLTFYVDELDPELQSLTYEAANLPSGACFNGTLADGTAGSCEPREFRWQVGYEQAGEHVVTFTVSDGTSEASETLPITVRENAPPVLDPIGAHAVAVSGKLELPITGSDADGDALSFFASGLPQGATFAKDEDAVNTWIFAWSPEEQDVGIYTVTFQVYDGGVADSERVTLTVTPLPPTDLFGAALTSGAVRLTWADHSGNETGFRIIRSRADDPGDVVERWVSNASIATIGTTAEGQPLRRWIDSTGLAPGAAYLYQVASYVQLADGAKIASTPSDAAQVQTLGTNLPPVLEPIGNQSVAVSGKLELTVRASDPDQEPVTLEAWRLNASGEMLERIDVLDHNLLGATFADNGDGTGDFVWQTDASDAGSTHRILFIAADPGKQEARETILIQVQ